MYVDNNDHSTYDIGMYIQPILRRLDEVTEINLIITRDIIIIICNDPKKNKTKVNMF